MGADGHVLLYPVHPEKYGMEPFPKEYADIDPVLFLGWNKINLFGVELYWAYWDTSDRTPTTLVDNLEPGFFSRPLIGPKASSGEIAKRKTYDDFLERHYGLPIKDLELLKDRVLAFGNFMWYHAKDWEVWT